MRPMNARGRGLLANRQLLFRFAARMGRVLPAAAAVSLWLLAAPAPLPAEPAAPAAACGEVASGGDQDSDGVADCADSCPSLANPLQSDVDSDGLGDLCDPCPARGGSDCDPAGSTAAELPPERGGVLHTADASLALEVAPSALGAATTLSATRLASPGLPVEVLLDSGPASGEALSLHELQPAGQALAEPALLALAADASALGGAARQSLSVYRFDPDAQRYLPLSQAGCVVGADATGADAALAVCTARVEQLSRFAVLAAATDDADGDGLPAERDPCPSYPNALPLADADGDGIPDECQCGDANGDGQLNVLDARRLKRCALGLSADCDPELGDATGEGELDSLDSRRIEQVAVELRPAWDLRCPRRPEGTPPPEPPAPAACPLPGVSCQP
jgi:hypothetical protein